MDSAAIVVSGYDKRGDGINAYISYTVKVKTADGEEEAAVAAAARSCGFS